MHRSRSALQPGVSHPSVVLVPVLLIAVGCSGGDGLRPEPGSVVALAFSQFLDSATQVYCWGETAAWLAGAGVGMSLVPRQLTTPLAFQELAVGLGELCGVVASAGTYCWGQATTTPNPTLLPGAPQFVRLALSRHR